MTLTEKRESSRIIFRVDSDLKERIARDAEERFGGNESMTVRAALELYLDLRDVHGPHFDLIVLGLRQPRELKAAI